MRAARPRSLSTRASAFTSLAGMSMWMRTLSPAGRGREIEAAIGRAAETPRRDADAEVEGRGPLGVDDQLDVTIPRILRRLGEGEPRPVLVAEANFGARADEQVDVHAGGVRC